MTRDECAELAKPEWWNDEELKALSARVVRTSPDDWQAHHMRAVVLSGQDRAWETGPRSAAEFKETATHFDGAAALCNDSAEKARLTRNAEWCRRRVEATQRCIFMHSLFMSASSEVPLRR